MLPSDNPVGRQAGTWPGLPWLLCVPDDKKCESGHEFLSNSTNMSADSFLGAALRSGGPFKDPGSMRIWGPAPFFPASERRESGMEIILRWDGNRFALRQPIWCAPSGKFFDRGVDLAFSEIGGKRFAGFHFGVLRQLLEAFAFLFRLGIHSVPKSLRHVA